jgi:hypothetical protein
MELLIFRRPYTRHHQTRAHDFMVVDLALSTTTCLPAAAASACIICSSADPAARVYWRGGTMSPWACHVDGTSSSENPIKMHVSM